MADGDRDRVREATDIVDLISEVTKVRRSGRTFMAICPFHEEKTPSFHVFPESGRYKCFGCGEGGEVFNFLMKRNNIGFREVVEELAREARIPLPKEQEDPDEARRARLRTEALKALEFAAGFFSAVLARFE